jgi:hypothetical protein
MTGCEQYDSLTSPSLLHPTKKLQPHISIQNNIPQNRKHIPPQSSARKESKRSAFQGGKTARLKDNAFIFPQDRSFSRDNIEKKELFLRNPKRLQHVQTAEINDRKTGSN